MASPRKIAVIIKGNPALVAHNERAERFYADLEAFLRDFGFTVLCDAGEPYTVPPPADVWIGHSRGADRLRFAPPGMKTIGIGVPATQEARPFPIVNHPDDAMVQRTFSEGVPLDEEPGGTLDDDNHYVLTEAMKTRLRELLAQK